MPQFINCKGQLINLTEKPLIMGILNITPDSFFEKSRVQSEDEVIEKARKMLADGATFLDLGGHSTRPGAEGLSQQQEADRVLPAIEVILKYFPETLITIDTFRASVARQAVEAGACMVNDISGGNLDELMFETVASLNVPYVLMHSRGTPQTMTQLTQYENLVLDILEEIQQKIYQLRQLGQKDIIIDLGFGFAKTADQNYELIRHLQDFKILDCPMLVGVSRKSMIWRKLNITADQALNATTALNTIALMGGANILRVHDVREAKEAIEIVGLVGQVSNLSN
jgi:dihydropteroate synthase